MKKEIREHLAEAEENVKKGEDRISKQKERVKTLASDGHDTGTAEQTLEQFEKLQGTMKKHRDSIREELKNNQSSVPSN
jgi:hypothetical protein